MSDLLKISLVQSDLIWGNVKENLTHFSRLIDNCNQSTDLIILPEMFTSGFIMHDKQKIAPYAEQSLNWMQEIAASKDSVVLGSLIVEDNGKFYNRLYIVNASGEIAHYDKRHLFRMGQEHSHFHQGTERIIFKIKNWRICPLVCYDLRFPVWSRGNNEYDLLVYIANWPAARSHAWNTLLMARAIENQSYVVGVNRVGVDGMNIKYTGDSCVYDAKAGLRGKCAENKTQISTFSIDLLELNDFRNKFPVYLDADSFQITNKSNQ
jgi:predicted amidohydrolase